MTNLRIVIPLKLLTYLKGGHCFTKLELKDKQYVCYNLFCVLFSFSIAYTEYIQIHETISSLYQQLIIECLLWPVSVIHYGKFKYIYKFIVLQRRYFGGKKEGRMCHVYTSSKRT